jgi:hypothetical protein
MYGSEDKYKTVTFMLSLTTAGKPGTLEESSTAVDDERSDSISCLDES